jgi:hypothetical protein
MKDIREALSLVFLWLVVAIYVLLALLLCARVLADFVRQWRGERSVKGAVHTGRSDRRAGAVFDSGVRGILGVGRRVRPWTARITASTPQEPAGVKAQAGNSVASETGAAWHRL